MTGTERERYIRQLPIADWGEVAQARLAASRVAVVGAGGLGAPVALYLAAAGVGSITVCDYQELELSNLNRQILYATEDVGRLKTECAAERLRELNPGIGITPAAERVTEHSVGEILAGSDLVVDCLDNFETRRVLNRWCWNNGVPLLHAGIREFYGQLLFIRPPDSCCLACFMPDSVPEAEPPAVVGATAGVVGSLQAAEALKYLGGIAPVDAGVLRMIDLMSMQLESLPVARWDQCPVCGKG